MTDLGLGLWRQATEEHFANPEQNPRSPSPSLKCFFPTQMQLYSAIDSLSYRESRPSLGEPQSSFRAKTLLKTKKENSV